MNPSIFHFLLLNLIERAYVCIIYEFEVPFLLWNTTLSVDMHYRMDFPGKSLCMKSVAKNDLATFNNISQSLIIHMLCYAFLYHQNWYKVVFFRTQSCSRSTIKCYCSTFKKQGIFLNRYYMVLTYSFVLWVIVYYVIVWIECVLQS